jgi:hypothetical protein
MKYPYLQFRNLRVWLLRRRLRQMGFREVADRASAQTLLRLQMDASNSQRLILDWIKIGLITVAVLSMWLIFGFRLLEPIQIVVPPTEKPSSLPSLPDAMAPAHWNFGEPTLHPYTA